MKTLLILLATCALAGAADNDNQLRMADTKTIGFVPYSSLSAVQPMVEFSTKQVQTITIFTGKGQIIINLDTGEVTKTGTVTLSEGAETFYKAVAQQAKRYPHG